MSAGAAPAPKDFAPRASGWFSPTVEYVGRARADFEAPRGSIGGPATVSVDEAGRVSVRMVPEAESLESDVPTPHGMRGFLGGEGYAREVSPGVTSIDSRRAILAPRWKSRPPRASSSPTTSPTTEHAASRGPGR